MIILILIVILALLTIYKNNKLEHFIDNTSSTRMIPYRNVKNFIDNKNLNCPLKVGKNKLDIEKKHSIRHYIGIQCYKFNRVIYIYKKATLLEDNTVFDFTINKQYKSIDIDKYYKQLYERVNTLFLMTEFCNNTTQFTILTMDVILDINNTLYFKEFNYHNKDDPIHVDVFSDFTKCDNKNNYIKIYPKENTYKSNIIDRPY